MFTKKAMEAAKRFEHYYSQKELDHLLTLHARGILKKDIAKKLGMPTQTIHYWLKRIIDVE